jgi:DNA-binding transcriptional MerR regulator
VPIPTIKYYLREGLLPPGVATAANQADYAEEHVRRLRLIRALIDVGGVSVAGARGVVGALTAEDDPLELLGTAQEAVAPRRRAGRETPAWAAARERVLALIAARGWLIHPESTAIALVADTLAAAETLEVSELFAHLDEYVDAAAGLAATEVRTVLDRSDPAGRMELVVLGTVLGEALFNGLRMLAHQHESARQLDQADDRGLTGGTRTPPDTPRE